ncbi:MAG: TadE/TadG family type IV pilus assembly protein [Streptosporangiaceae bacterium]
MSARDGRPRRRRTPNDGGNAPLELVILAPVVIFLIGLVIAAGRVLMAQAAVSTAAQAAARQASISLSAAVARRSAPPIALAVLRQDGLRCAPEVSLGLAGFGLPAGVPAQVSATVRCTVRLSDLLVPGLPWSCTLRARFVSPLDPYRARTLVAAPTGDRRGT